MAFIKNMLNRLQVITFKLSLKWGAWVVPFLSVFVALMFFDFLYQRFFHIPFVHEKVIITLIYAMLFASIISLFRKQKTRNWITFGVIAVLTLLYLVEAVYFRAFHSVALISAFSRLADLGGAKDSVKEFLSYDLLFFGLPVLFFALYMFKTNNVHVLHLEKKDSKIPLLMLIFSILMLFLNNYQSVHIVGDINRETFRNPTLFFKTYGALDTAVKELSVRLSGEPVIGKDMNERYVEENFRYEPHKNNKTNIFKGKNLVFIEGESMGTFSIDQRLTPTLYKLQQEGMNFTNYYSSRINTFESEYAILNSFYLTPEKEQSAFTPQGTMPTLFREKGYNSQSFHDYLSEMYSRPTRHVELGFEKFYGANYLGITVEPGSDYPSDVALFKESFNIYSKEKQPFFSYTITMSAHAPYNSAERPSLSENLKQVEALYPNYTDNSKTYLAAAMQTDQGVAQLLADLRDAGLYDDTVIAFVGDHYPYALRENIEKDFGIKDSLENYKVPFIIWDSTIQHEDVQQLTSNVDILPTLSNMFDLNLKYTMGQDVFSDKASDVIVDWHHVRSYSFKTPEFGYDGDTGKTDVDVDPDVIKYYQETSYLREEVNNSEYVRYQLKR